MRHQKNNAAGEVLVAEPEELISVVDVPHEAEPDAWNRDMDAAPRDSTLVQILVGKRDFVAKWHITRQRDAALRRWVPVGYWADPVTRERLPGEPDGWRMLDGYLTPGMVV